MLQSLGDGVRYACGVLLGRCVGAGARVGGNTAIFSVIHAMILNPIPFSNPDEPIGCFWEIGDILTCVLWRDPRCHV
jgi:hypothetical protein